MNKKELTDIISAIQNLKKIKRRGWEIKLDMKHPESVADHSYSTAILSMVIGDYLELNTNRMVKMALIHDLAESIIGDYMPGENDSKEIEENNAMKVLLDTLPKKLKNEYNEIWKEYQRNETKESKTVHDIDKFEMGLQSVEYSKILPNNDNVKDFYDEAIKVIETEEIRKILEEYSNNNL